MPVPFAHVDIDVFRGRCLLTAGGSPGSAALLAVPALVLAGEAAVKACSRIVFGLIVMSSAMVLTSKDAPEAA